MSTNPASHSPQRPSLLHRFRWGSEGPTWELAAAMLLGILVLVASFSGVLLLVTGQGVSTAGQLGDAIGGHLNVVLNPPRCS
jgi:hypothetical protein